MAMSPGSIPGSAFSGSSGVTASHFPLGGSTTAVPQ